MGGILGDLDGYFLQSLLGVSMVVCWRERFTGSEDSGTIHDAFFYSSSTVGLP